MPDESPELTDSKPEADSKPKTDSKPDNVSEPESDSKPETNSTPEEPEADSTPAEPESVFNADDAKTGQKSKLKFISFIVVIAAIALFTWADQQRRDANEKLANITRELEEIRSVSKNTSDEAAQRIIEQVRQHMVVPSEPIPTVATIQDIDALRETDNAFYDKAENGDHILITPTRAILYDPDSDRIIDVVPVRIERKTDDDDSASGAAN